MQREVSLSFGIVLERRPATSRWTDWVWSVPEVIIEAPATDGWCEIEARGETRRYLSAPHCLTLHHKMVEAYDSNIETGEPCLWVLLNEADGPEDPGWRVAAITADPHQAIGFLDSGEGLVERVPMPRAVIAWMAEYLKSLPEAPAFRKRQRDRMPDEVQLFGKTPIFKAPAGKVSARDGAGKAGEEPT